MAEERRKEWDVRTELLAVIADRLGVAASSREYKEPPKPITRPTWMTETQQPQQVEGNAFAAAASRLAATAKRVIR